MVINVSVSDLESLKKLSLFCPFPREDNYWEIALDRQDKGELSIFAIFDNSNIVGFVIFNRKPQYNLFSKMDIPEIQDLFIHPDFRGKGFGKALVFHCEKLALEEGCSEIGIGVGVLPSYGAAQSLYVSMGYIPDGQGMNCDRETIKEGDSILFNHDIALMFIKKLHPLT